jgi:hypothetical protein
LPRPCYFTPEELADDLRSVGFSEIEDLGPTTIAVRYFGAPTETPPSAGGHILRAATRRQSA